MYTASRYAAVRYPARRPPPPPPAPTPISNTKFALLVGALVIASGLLVLLPNHNVSTLPSRVQGTWMTNAPRYAGRQLVIGARSISFQAGASYDDMSSHIILHVDTKQVPQGTLYMVQYVDGSVYNDPGMIQFIYHPASEPELMLAHQTEIVWTRATGG